MSDVTEFVAQCARSGTLLTSLCALVLFPTGAWFACRLVASAITALNEDATSQAPLAAIAAGLPGALFVMLGISALIGGLDSACLSLPAGRLVFGGLIAAMIAAFTRATWLAFVRSIEVRRLICSSSDPSPRLRTIAYDTKVTARELSERSPVCALAGVATPLVLVSTGALTLLSDEELRAALCHERAHARRGDQVLSAALSFLVDLLPLPAADLVETYRTARELAADGDAIRATSANALAGALIQFAKGGRAVSGAACLTGDQSSLMTRRLRALLGIAAPLPLPNRFRRTALALALTAIAAAGIFTPPLAGQHAASCEFTMRADR